MASSNLQQSFEEKAAANIDPKQPITNSDVPRTNADEAIVNAPVTPEDSGTSSEESDKEVKKASESLESRTSKYDTETEDKRQDLLDELDPYAVEENDDIF